MEKRDRKGTNQMRILRNYSRNKEKNMFIDKCTISIIIVNKNDLGINNTLNALAHIYKPKRTEIIVVDASNGKLNNIRDIHKEVKWIEYINKEKGKFTIDEQRNLGIMNSTGELIVFLDANCIPVKNWLNLLVRIALKEKELIVAGGVKSANRNDVNTITHNYKEKYIPEAPTINLLINRRVINTIGYFHEDGTYGGDVDFTWRAVDAGFKIRYVPGAFVVHDMGTFFEQCNRMMKYATARVILFKRYKNRIRKMSINDFVMVIIYPLYILFLPLVLIFPFYPFLLIIPIIKNIKNQPLKVAAYNLAFGLGVIKELFFQMIKKG